MDADLIIIGGGPAGYFAAETAAKEGLSVILFEENQLGGVCLNEGCIPTKSLLNSAKIFSVSKNSEKFGVSANPSFNIIEANKWKDETVIKLRKSLELLMKHNHINLIKKNAKIIGPNTVKTDEEIYKAENILLATGSSFVVPKIPGIENAITSKEVLSLQSIPSSVIIIGGGVIGIELASFFSCLNVEVTVVEMLPEIVPLMDAEMASILRRSMSSVNFLLSSKVEKIEKDTVYLVQDKKELKIKADLIIVATGRRPLIDNESFFSIGLDFSEKGVRTDERMKTNIPGLYAAGDITGRFMLAHAAYRMGQVAVNNICNKKDIMREFALPWVIYSLPEAAGVGLTEEELKKREIPYKKSVVPMRANGRFLAEHGEQPGACKILVYEKTGILAGVHMVGSYASEIISSATVMIECELRDREIKEIIFPHPTVSEIIKDSILGLK